VIYLTNFWRRRYDNRTSSRNYEWMA